MISLRGMMGSPSLFGDWMICEDAGRSFRRIVGISGIDRCPIPTDISLRQLQSAKGRLGPCSLGQTHSELGYTIRMVSS